MSLTFKAKHVLMTGCFGLMSVIPSPGFGQSGVAVSDTLGTSHLVTPVKERIYQGLQKEFRDMGGLGQPVLGAFPLKMIRLSPDGKQGVRIWARSQENVPVCGATGNCDIWVFDSKTGDLLLSANGFDLQVESVIHHGRYDILARHNMSAGSGVCDLYQFDGHEYQNVQETNETYR